MIKILEKLLFEKTEGMQSEILYAQWNYDKKIIPVALNTISQLFPHYSLHDETHSKTIINNIVRIIGKENLCKLSSIDIWLILEASYCHDIGMVVSFEEIAKTLNSVEFIDFFLKIQHNIKSNLHEYTKAFEIKDRKFILNSNEFSLEYYDGIKFILADFFRAKHAERSKDIINNENIEIQTSSPRTIIPKRIFNILGNICSCHTQNFDDVMKLPYCEVGLDNEDAHPRFISCLLRLGDLLDLDNNRFSEVCLRTLSKIPTDTIMHREKHYSIKSLRIDKELIEITAICDDYDIASITQHWFEYLDSEIKKQMVNWSKIVPSSNFGYLPAIGNLNVELDKYDYIDAKKKPKFIVDNDKAIELLKGTGIYKNSNKSIIELIQNSIDATLIRIWLEYKNEKTINLEYPNDEAFRVIANNYNIEIHINKIKSDNSFTYWKVSIVDKGIGISTYDLGFLMNTGSSSNNVKKNSIIEKMPDWLRPSGIFGIGFQSVFMLTEEVIILTKSFFTEEYQSITCHSPESKREGSILIKKENSSYKIKPGTNISFNIKTTKIPIKWSLDSKQTHTLNFINKFDPFTDDSLDIEIGKVIDEICNYSLIGRIPIYLYFNDEKIQTNTNNTHFKYFDTENQIELNINPNIKTTNLYYKDRLIKTADLRFNYIGLEINIHKDKASTVLELNREKIRDDYKNKLAIDCMYSAYKIITSNFDEIFEKDEEKIAGSMFLDYYQFEHDSLQKFDLSRFKHWENYKLSIDNKNESIKDLLSTTNDIHIEQNMNVINIYYNIPNITINRNKEDEITIKYNSPNTNAIQLDFFLHKFCQQNANIIQNELTNEKNTITISRNEQKYTEDNTNLCYIINKCRNTLYTRYIIPCLDKYSKLKLKPEAWKEYIYEYSFNRNLVTQSPKMLCPYIKTNDNKDEYPIKISLNQEVYDWVYTNRNDTNTTLDDIINGYNDFIKDFTIERILKQE